MGCFSDGPKGICAEQGLGNGVETKKEGREGVQTTLIVWQLGITMAGGATESESAWEEVRTESYKVRAVPGGTAGLVASSRS